VCVCEREREREREREILQELCTKIYNREGERERGRENGVYCVQCLYTQMAQYANRRNQNSEGFAHVYDKFQICVAVCCSMLQCVAHGSETLQVCVAVCCSALQCVSVLYMVIKTHKSVLQ